MSRFSRRAALFGLGSLGLGRARGATHLSIGDKAPPFSLPGTNGKTESLESYLGKNNVVLAFFPKAFTGG